MHTPTKSLSLAPVCALVCALAAIPTACRADKGEPHSGRDSSATWMADDDSHDRALEASERGEILPIAEIYERARARYPGRVLEAELDREQGRWVYELKVLDPAGRLREVYLDAQSGAVLGHEEGD